MDELSNDFDLEIMQNASWNLEYEDDFNETADNFGNGTNSNATIDCGVLDEDYIRVWSSFQWWLEGVGFTGLGIAGTYVIRYNSRGAGLRPAPRSRCTGTRCWQGLVQGVTGFGTRYGRVK